MTLIEYMNAGNQVVSDKISAYVDKDVFNNLLKMSYASLELIAPADMVTVYTDTVLAVNKYKYDTLLASAAAEFQSGTHSTNKETHSGSDVQTTESTNTLNQSGTSSDSTTQNSKANTTSSATGENTTTYGHIVDSTNTTSGKSTPGTVTENNSVYAYDSDTSVPHDSRTRTEGESTTSQTVTAKDTNSGTDKVNTTTSGTNENTLTGATSTSGESSSTSTNAGNSESTTQHGHIISSEYTEEKNSPEYIAAMRAAASFSLAKIIAVDITAAICAGVW